MQATRARYYYYLLLIIKQIIEYFPACPLRFGAASLEMQRTLLCAMHSRACADPRRSLETLQRGEHAST